MLGVSRGTLRTALQRLEAGGEIVRRQGSGTFVGAVARPPAFVEGLERLEPYSLLARQRGITLGVRDVEFGERRLGAELGRVFGLPPDTVAPRVTRVVVADDRPSAYMVDVIHPDLPLPGEDELRAAFASGRMLLDVLLERGVPIAFATTRVCPRLIDPARPRGPAVRRSSARRPRSSSRSASTSPRARSSTTRRTCSRPRASICTSCAPSRSRPRRPSTPRHAAAPPEHRAHAFMVGLPVPLDASHPGGSRPGRPEGWRALVTRSRKQAP